ncbi:response regulator transcription factor [Hugenholtzia roseola]|uniref:response regulator transcription factor n=1 Tax=Hugenholtzia roseola TaxID=1002 RepID=UPI00047BF327|nr:response regulator transcription factor [Hugenholtzia roseola]
MQKRILLVEDDTTLGFIVEEHLVLAGYQVCWCQTGDMALSHFEAENFDLCIFDVMLPKIDGFELLTTIRKQNTHVPILFLTAKALSQDKIKGLKLGADDYITKPFSLEELILKVEIFLKRTRLPDTPLQMTAQYFILHSYRFEVDNLLLIHLPTQQRRSLTLREGNLLALFCKNANQLLKREAILVAIWGEDDYFAGRSLDVFISRLRKYLSQESLIRLENVPRVGFRLVV